VRKAIRDHATDFAAIIGLLAIALAVAGYILANQRMRFPLIEDAPKKLYAEFSTAQAVTPGQGQTVRVSGVRIGTVGAVKLREGRAVVTFDIDPKYDDLVREDARALLRPKTALKDMFVEVTPGRGPVAKDGFTLPVENTLPDINPDEVLSALDADTRDHLRLLVQGAGEGLRGRGDELNEVFKRFEPTHRDLARVTAKVAERRQNLRRLVTSLNRLNGALGQKDDDLAQLVDASARVFRAFASQDRNITTAVGELPSALRQTTDTLGKVETFAKVLRPSLDRLSPAVRRLDEANDALRPLAKAATPLLRNEIRPFVRESRPLVRALRPAARSLATSTPDLTRSFTVLNHLFNLIGYNDNGREGPSVAGRDEGYLFWIAWLGHNAGAVFSTADATGIFRPVAIQATCSTIKQSIADEPELGFLQGLIGAVLDPRICSAG
jgi:phospholipid/cholesterol/gamma-HCH transport system substrate-binding protein